MSFAQFNGLDSNISLNVNSIQTYGGGTSLVGSTFVRSAFPSTNTVAGTAFKQTLTTTDLVNAGAKKNGLGNYTGTLNLTFTVSGGGSVTNYDIEVVIQDNLVNLYNFGNYVSNVNYTSGSTLYNITFPFTFPITTSTSEILVSFAPTGSANTVTVLSSSNASCSSGLSLIQL